MTLTEEEMARREEEVCCSGGCAAVTVDSPLEKHTDECKLLREAHAEIRRLRRIAELVETVTPYVIATLPKPHDGSPESNHEGWGCAHLGRSASSVDQLEHLRKVAREALR